MLVTKEDIASFLKAKRTEMKLSGSEVCKKLDSLYGIQLSPKTLWGYENGVSRPDANVFVVLCKIYEVCDPVAEIQQLPSMPVKKVQLSPREELLINYFRRASQEKQDAVLLLLEPSEKDGTSSLVG